MNQPITPPLILNPCFTSAIGRYKYDRVCFLLPAFVGVSWQFANSVYVVPNAVLILGILKERIWAD